MLSIQNLTKKYTGGFVALNNINLEINEGEIFALLGPNGAGKSTLINTICGLVQPTEGTITIAGFDSQKDYRKAREIVGLVPQEIMIDIFDTVWNVLVFARGYFGKKHDPALYEQILRDLSLWDKKDSPIQSLSGGMKRRVLIARALTNEPKLLFLDEPTAGVDVELRKDMMEIIKRLKAQGTTIILTTHYIEEAEELADRVGIISGGEIKMVEEKQTLMKRLGKKILSISLASPITTIPSLLKDTGLELSQDGTRLLITYSADKGFDITSLLGYIKDSGLQTTDVDSETSSLEEIFVGLLNKT